MLSIIVFLLSGLSLWPGAAVDTTDAAHKFHVTYGRMVVENNVAVCNVRYFGHDLEETLQVYFDRPDFKLEVSPEADSLYQRYFNKTFVMEHKGVPLQAQIVTSGEEGEMWWYAVQYEADSPIAQFNIKNVLLFDLYDDQKNVFKVRHFPSEETRSYYFTEGAEQYEVNF